MIPRSYFYSIIRKERIRKALTLKQLHGLLIRQDILPPRQPLHLLKMTVPILIYFAVVVEVLEE